MISRIPTLVLRVIVAVFAAAGVLVCVFPIPTFALGFAKFFPQYTVWRFPILIGLYIAALCFYYALFQFWLLLGGIDRDGALLPQKLKKIRYSAAVFSVLYAVFAMPLFYFAAELEDAPGVILVGAILDAIPIGVAAFAAVLERIGQK
jgi:hypothetical protein